MFAYHVVARFGRTDGLVVQNIPLDRLDVPVINADMSGAEFKVAWAGLPFTLRLTVAAFVPFVVLGALVVGNRRMIASQLRQDDLPSRDDVLQDSESVAKLESVVLERRDQLLVKALTDVYDTWSSEPIRVAVPYGAGHMPAVVRYLAKRHGYWPQSSEWLTVFGF